MYPVRIDVDAQSRIERYAHKQRPKSRGDCAIVCVLNAP